VVEQAGALELFTVPRHPYTRLLLHSVPRVSERHDRLRTIEGAAPSPGNLPLGCRFHPRCPLAIERCRQSAPTLDTLAGNRQVRCLRAEETALAYGPNGQADGSRGARSGYCPSG
jgi:oligopeptide/dipeptide ABC transporter ATP-binding protein